MNVLPASQTIAFDPHVIVLFGATGDLAHRKLLPAIFELASSRGFADETVIVGVATRELDEQSFVEGVVDSLLEAGWEEADVRPWAVSTLRYQRIGEGYDALRDRIEQIEAERGLPGNRVFYLAIPPSVFDDTVEGLTGAGLTTGPGWTRVVVEKPFGTDLDSARYLNERLHSCFDERQIFRIDHYLAKETVQNLLVFRFANMLFESGWNRNQIESVEITVAETLGLEGRASYFEKAGIIRDIVQNHLLQVLTLVAMEPPVKLTADAIRDEKVKVLRSIYPVTRAAVTRGRYEAGMIEGRDVPGYLDEDGVEPDSDTETYASIRIDVDNWRWRGVPFVLRAGKRLKRRVTQIAVRYREAPVSLFETDGACRINGNVLYITLQPDEGFHLTFDVKEPGDGMDLVTEHLEFHYADAFGSLPDAYVTLIADVLSGDQTLFVRADEAEEAWRILEPALDLRGDLQPYAAGTWGPGDRFDGPDESSA